MSAETNTQAAVPAATIESEAADWLMERDSADWNETGQAALDSWLAQSLAHRIAFLRLEATWGRTERLAALRNPDGARPFKARMPVFFAGIAAAAAIVAALGFAGARFVSAPADRVFSTPVGGRELVSFADGSQIELNTDTVLRTHMTTGARTVWIEKGEAYFRVKHDAKSPFVVIAGRRRITDLGTKFFVRRDLGRLEVALIEGSVRYSGGNRRTSELLKPGDDLVAAKETSLTKKTAQELANEIAWRRGVLVFRHTTLADAAAEFNRYNRRQIRIADAEAARRTIDGTFLTNDIEAFTDAAETIFGLKVRGGGNTIVISR
ncbi:MAG TPA: FecR domain-containing protein [Rhizomicrobium sp.]|nr:FecR domain-containing protein [Rhizomicrobium sp.]